jgi:hypothetical protein
MPRPHFLRAFTLLALAVLTSAAPAAEAPAHGAHADHRRVLPLDEGERAFVRTEMRGFLAALQAITVALERGDYRALAQAARAQGMQSTHHVPATLRAKLPLEFRQIGQGVHGQFDMIALDAETLEDMRHTLAQTGELLGRCVACHATFRLGP